MPHFEPTVDLKSTLPISLRLSIVVPVFNEGMVIRQTAAALLTAFEILPAQWQVVFVNDGSCDGSPAILDELVAIEPRFAVIHLARNFGHQMAVTAGLDLVECDAAVVMDADLQDPPQVVAQMVQQFYAGADMVLAVRRKRESDGWFKRISAALFYWVLRQGHKQSCGENAGDFRLYSARALTVMRAMREEHRYLRGMADWAGLTKAWVEYDRPPRAGGEAKYTLKKMLALAWTALISFSGGQALLIGYVAAGVLTLGGLLAFLGMVIDYEYWQILLLMGVQILLTGIVLLSLAVLTDYASRAYSESKRRPLYLVDRIQNLAVPELVPPRVVILPEANRRPPVP